MRIQLQDFLSKRLLNGYLIIPICLQIMASFALHMEHLRK